MNPSEKTVLSVLSYSLLRNALPEKAAALLEALDLLEPGQPRTLQALVVAQVRSGQADKALRTLDRLAMTGAVDAMFHLLRAQALRAAGRPMEASVAMKTFVELRQSTAAAATEGSIHD